MLTAEQAETGGTNHPLALRMASIAFLNSNITIGCIWGSFSVLLGAVEQRLGVGRELSTLGVPLINLATAALAPLLGVYAARISLRLLMIVGALFSTAGFLLLATTHSYAVYLMAFGLLLGPGQAVGVIMPATLITRWYVVNRGKALGLAGAPILIAAVPLSINWVLQSYGLSGAYIALAALSSVSVVANLFIIDHPPGSVAATAHADGTAAPSAGISVGGLLRTPRFWALAVAAISCTTCSIVLTAHMVPMARTWGFTATLAASLLAVQSFVGIAGTIVFGWVADRLGGAATLALITFDGAILWALLLLHLSFPATLVVVGLIGMHGAGALPVTSMVLSEAFGRESFSRAYGLLNLLNLPFSVACVPLAGLVYTQTGSYTGAILGQMLFFAIAVLLALSARRRRGEVAMA